MLKLCDPTEISDYPNHVKKYISVQNYFYVKIVRFFCVSKSLKKKNYTHKEYTNTDIMVYTITNSIYKNVEKFD